MSSINCEGKPLYLASLAIVGWIEGGVRESGSRAVSAVIGIFSLLALSFAAFRIFAARAPAILAMAISAVSLFHVMYSRLILANVFLPLLFLASLYFFTHRDELTWRKRLLWGLLLGAGMGFHPVYVITLCATAAAILIDALFSSVRWTDELRAAVPVLLGFAGALGILELSYFLGHLLLVSSGVHSSSGWFLGDVFKHGNEAVYLGSLFSRLRHALVFYSSLFFGLEGPIVFGLFITGIAAGVRSSDRKLRRLVLYSTVLLGSIVLFPFVAGRIMVVALPAIALIAALGGVHLAQQIARHVRLNQRRAIVLVAAVVMVYGVWNTLPLLRLTSTLGEAASYSSRMSTTHTRMYIGDPYGGGDISDKAMLAWYTGRNVRDFTDISHADAMILFMYYRRSASEKEYQLPQSFGIRKSFDNDAASFRPFLAAFTGWTLHPFWRFAGSFPQSIKETHRKILFTANHD
ncbi:MAG: phospholipid carrier-dependent glycosyltransferase [Bacteroidota bacterium]